MPWLSVASLLFAACGPTSATTDDGGEETDLEGLHCSESYVDGEPWLELGQGVVEYRALEAGGEFDIVLGGQGLLMFPLGLRAGGFCVPPDLSERDEFPILDAVLEVEGEESPFIEIADQPVDFIIEDDDTFVWFYVPLLLPDGSEPLELEGRSVFVHARLDPYAIDPLEVDLEMRVGVGE